MSQALLKRKNFILSLLAKSKEKKKFLLTGANTTQLRILAEIFYNIGNLPLLRSKQKKLTQYKPLLKRFVNNVSQREEIVQHHYRAIFKVLALIKKYLYILLQ